MIIFKKKTIGILGISILLFSSSLYAQDALDNLLKTSRDNMVFIQGGAYTMGQFDPSTDTPGPKTTVIPFYISKDNVSWGEYDVYSKAINVPYLLNDLRKGNYFSRQANYPADGLTWYQANDYCQFLAKKTGLPYDLPTQAQWEYVARDGGKPNWDFPTNNGKQELGKNFPSDKQLSSQPGNNGWIDAPLPIGSIPCTPMGICGLTGAVNEWTKDSDSTGKLKMVRGGAAFGSPEFLNAYNHNGIDPNAVEGGFRCVINSTTSPAQLGAFAK